MASTINICTEGLIDIMAERWLGSASVCFWWQHIRHTNLCCRQICIDLRLATKSHGLAGFLSMGLLAYDNIVVHLAHYQIVKGLTRRKYMSTCPSINILPFRDRTCLMSLSVPSRSWIHLIITTCQMVCRCFSHYSHAWTCITSQQEILRKWRLLHVLVILPVNPERINAVVSWYRLVLGNVFLNVM